VSTKKFVVDTYKDRQYLYTLNFNSRKELVQYLRERHVKFKNEVLCDLDSGDIVLRDNGFLAYHIEEMAECHNTIEHGGLPYLPLRTFAEATRFAEKNIRYWYKRGQMQGLTVGRTNSIYICIVQDGNFIDRKRKGGRI
jgi:hypothetical protein